MTRLRKHGPSDGAKKPASLSDEPRKRGVKSVDLAGRILVALCKYKKAVSLSELSEQTRIPPAKLHRYLTSLTYVRMVQQDIENRKYWFGPLALEIGAAATSGSDDLSNAIARQVKLRNLVGETISLSVWSASGPIILHVEQANREVITTMKVGSILPILTTAAGIVFASILPTSTTQFLIEQEFVNTEATFNPIVKTRAALMRLSVAVKNRGYVYNRGHLLPGIGALAAPVWGAAGQLVGVFSIIGQSSQIDPSRNKAVLAELLRQAGGQ
jgi:DNA-binding IclR family transcriptional regulator